MEHLGRLLVVDDSAVVRELLSVVFAPHCSEVRSVESDPSRGPTASGAFLETPGPLPIGTQLELRLALGESVVPARASVVRVQEPAWSRPGGVGVRFEALPPETRAVLDRYLAETGLY